MPFECVQQKGEIPQTPNLKYSPVWSSSGSDHGSEPNIPITKPTGEGSVAGGGESGVTTFTGGTGVSGRGCGSQHMLGRQRLIHNREH